MNVNPGNEGVICPNCGMINKQGYRFCVKCGTNLTSSPTLSSSAVTAEPAGTPSFGAFEQPKPVEPAAPTFGEFGQSKSVEPAGAPSFGAFEQSKPAEPAGAPSFGAFEQHKPVEPTAAPTFGAFEQPKPVKSTVAPSFGTYEQPEPVKPTAAPTFGTYEQPKPVEPASAPSFGAFEQPKPAEPAGTPSFGTFEQPKPVEPASAPTFGEFGQSKPVELTAPTFNTFKQSDVSVDSSAGATLNNNQSTTSGFARYDFSETTTPTASVGAFAATLNAVKEEKIDVSDAQKILSLLEENEKSALAEGLPEWDIVPPQVVVRRKHRV